jgi:hypothetical protein
MSASTVGETRRINVLVVGESPYLFSSFRRLEKLGCKCHFAESHREVSKLLSQAITRPAVRSGKPVIALLFRQTCRSRV